MVEMKTENKTAVITGSNRGIGKKILEVFSGNGATIFACVRKIDEEFKSFLSQLKTKFNKKDVILEEETILDTTLKISEDEHPLERS